jgi:hypothetical protein
VDGDRMLTALCSSFSVSLRILHVWYVLFPSALESEESIENDGGLEGPDALVPGELYNDPSRPSEGR